MSNSQRGFSLVELIVVITIIGILAGVAYPSYQQYVVKTNVSNMYTYAKGLQAIVADEFIESGANDFSNITISTVPMTPTLTAKFVGGKLIVNGDESTKNTTLIMTPSYDPQTARISWSCTGNTDEKYLPSSCK